MAILRPLTHRKRGRQCPDDRILRALGRGRMPRNYRTVGVGRRYRAQTSCVQYCAAFGDSVFAMSLGRKGENEIEMLKCERRAAIDTPLLMRRRATDHIARECLVRDCRA